jgi:hypothetical protein
LQHFFAAGRGLCALAKERYATAMSRLPALGLLALALAAAPIARADDDVADDEEEAGDDDDDAGDDDTGGDDDDTGDDDDDGGPPQPQPVDPQPQTDDDDDDGGDDDDGEGPAPTTVKPKKPRKEIPNPDEGIARPDPPDLRTGHFLVSVSGGGWIPSTPVFPQSDELGDPAGGGTAHLHLGLGLGRNFVLELDGGFARAPSAGTCDGCSATSIDVGLAGVIHITQGFAFDPWFRYGMGYRHTLLSLDVEEDESVPSFDFTKVALGGSFFPVPSFGFGPYAQVDVGVHSFDDAVFYAAFHIGLQITYDPLRSGVSASPVASGASSPVW